MPTTVFGCAANRYISVTSASANSSCVVKIRFADRSHRGQNTCSAGFNSGLHGGSRGGTIPSGQITSPLRWLPESSRTTPIRSSGHSVAWRRRRVSHFTSRRLHWYEMALMLR